MYSSNFEATSFTGGVIEMVNRSFPVIGTPLSKSLRIYPQTPTYYQDEYTDVNS